jgi:hypothetical protein
MDTTTPRDLREWIERAEAIGCGRGSWAAGV